MSINISGSIHNGMTQWHIKRNVFRSVSIHPEPRTEDEFANIGNNHHGENQSSQLCPRNNKKP